MTTTATPVPSPTVEKRGAQSTSRPAAVTSLFTGPILVATDGTPGAGAACRLAGVLAARTGAEIRLLGVVPPLPTLNVDVPISVAPEVAEARLTELREQIRSAVIASSAGGTTWPIEVVEGPPSLMIAAQARDVRARAIVLGLGRHDVAHRLFGSETALQVLRVADVPVLAASPKATDEVQRAVIGVDFSAASLRAARVALALFPDLVEIDLVHVALPIGPPIVATPWESAYGTELREAWPRFVDDLAAPSPVVVQPITVKGYPAESLIARATDVGADVIVVGSHGRGFVSRMIVGSVATGVLRAAHTNVLAVPIVASTA